MRKIAVVLFNLGGPPDLSAVKLFLYNLFNDKAIIRVPSPFRQIIAWIISSRREEKAQEIYKKMGGGSPILKNTQAQANALQESLTLQLGNDVEVKTFIAMRYWHPFVEEAIKDVEIFNPEEVILLPLYPQFSTTTTASSLKEWQKQAAFRKFERPTKILCCYPQHPCFIEPLANQTQKAYDEANAYGKPRVLFSAHGLPEKIVKAGDPYPWQCEQTAQALVSALKIENLDWVLCYQSRVGPLAWIGPATDSEIRRAGLDKVPLIVVPIAFVSEHSETLVEIDIEYRELAQKQGVPHYIYVPTVSTNPTFIKGLAMQVQEVLQTPSLCQSRKGKRVCPVDRVGCCYNAFLSKEISNGV